MLEVRITGGYTATVATDLSDLLGSLDGATIKGALVAEGAAWPASGDAAWQSCNVSGSGSTRVVSQLLPSGQAPGHFWWWLWIQAGAAVSMPVLVMDPEDSDRPWLVWVH